MVSRFELLSTALTVKPARAKAMAFTTATAGVQNRNTSGEPVEQWFLHAARQPE